MRVLLVLVVLVLPMAAWAEPECPEAAAKKWELQEHHAQAAQAAEWRDHLAAEMGELNDALEKAPAEVAAIMKRRIALQGRLIQAMEEKGAGHEAANRELVEKAQAKIEEAERERAFVELDLEEAHMLRELREQAKQMGLTKEAEPLTAQMKELFQQAREIRTQIMELHDKEGRVHRQRESIFKRLHQMQLQREADKLEKELSAQ